MKFKSTAWAGAIAEILSGLGYSARVDSSGWWVTDAPSGRIEDAALEVGAPDLAMEFDGQRGEL